MSFSGFVDRHAKWIYPSFAILFIFAMMIFPLGYTVYNSFMDWSLTYSPTPVFTGFSNYVKIFTSDPRFWNSIWVTVYFTALAMVVEVVLGVLIAVLFDAKDFRGRRAVRSIFLMSMMATPVAVAMVWLLMYEPTAGILNYALRSLGLSKSLWITSSSTVVPALVLVDIWEWTPLIALIVIAGLAGLPAEPYESARVDGAGPFQIFFKITLPMIAPVVSVAALLRLIDCVKTFDIIYTMTMGGPGYSSENLNIYTYQTSFQYFNFGYASSLLVIFFTLVLGLSLIIVTLRKKLEV
ncbi:MAG: sugar ABC transporter permease [Synergistaceae bacterium]|jgi:multiple sugar transport system permease protein|nr:sugar ABC transporter permease [Synergistaceae bacterium]